MCYLIVYLITYSSLITYAIYNLFTKQKIAMCHIG